MKAGDRVIFRTNAMKLGVLVVRYTLGRDRSCFRLDGQRVSIANANLSLIDDKPTEYPFLQVDGIQEWYAGITPLTNEEIDKLGRGLSDD